MPNPLIDVQKHGQSIWFEEPPRVATIKVVHWTRESSRRSRWTRARQLQETND